MECKGGFRSLLTTYQMEQGALEALLREFYRGIGASHHGCIRLDVASCCEGFGKSKSARDER